MAEDEPSSSTTPTSTGVHIHGSVYGGGRGKADSFTCEKGMVGIVDNGENKNNTSDTYKDYGTRVNIYKGTVDGDVYGGGMVGRVEWNTQVTIGSASVTTGPVIGGSVFGAGAGVVTHGYSALVRGDSKITILGHTTVGKSVYGGGEKASVGRYWVNKPDLPEGAPDPGNVGIGRPFAVKSGGKCTVTIEGDAQIGTDSAEGGTEEAGNVFGACRGAEPNITGAWSIGSDGNRINYTTDNYDDYLAYLRTLGLSIQTFVNIGGNAQIKGSVYGGGELGDVGMYDTDTDGYNIYPSGVGICHVNITGGKVGLDGNTNLKKGNVFGAGKGLDFNFQCDKAMVSTTSVTISGGTVNGFVYGGGEIGRVENNTAVTIGLERVAESGKTYYEKHTDGETVTYSVVDVETGSSVEGYYIRSGEEGSYEYTLIEGSAPVITGSVFGAGQGLETHGYSALVRGNPTVTIQGHAKVGKNVYGGGEIATAGRYKLNADGLPIKQLRGGVCSVIVQGHAEIGPETATNTAGHVYGAGKGVEPDFTDTFQKMGPNSEWDEITSLNDYYSFLQTLALATYTSVTINGENVKVNGSVYGGSENGFVQHDASVTVQNGVIGNEDSYGNVFGGGKGYSGFPEAGRVGGNTTLIINGGTMNGSVYGGGELGIVKCNVNVNILDGTVENDVYGGGDQADTNTDEFEQVLGLTVGESLVTGLYTESDGEIQEITTENQTAAANTEYYKKVTGTMVNLLGGIIKQDAYGGGKGRSGGIAALEGNTKVNLNGMALSEYNNLYNSLPNDDFFKDYLDSNLTLLDVNGDDSDEDETPDDEGVDYYIVSGQGCIVKRIFGGNNLNGSPLGDVTVHVYATQNEYTEKTTIRDKFTSGNVDFDALDDTAEGLTDEQIAAIRSTLKGILQDKITIVNELKDEITEFESISASSYQDIHDDSSKTASQLKTAISGITKDIDDAIAAAVAEGGTDKEKESIKTTINSTINAFRYDVEAVYGGGNEAAYIPTTPYTTTVTTGSKCQVIIDGCAYTSIETVYGGGNAAPVPETNVTVNAAYEIGTVFGGGNGKDRKESDGSVNPGADVGTIDQGASDEYETGKKYGTGDANTLISGGYIHEAYGGSNEKGTIMHDINYSANAGTICPMLVEKMVTAGKNADIFGDAITTLGCMPDSWVKEYYGGADNANVHVNVELTITSGKFRKVFGGNNTGGIIMGHIKVNIEETGGCETPIIIDELYLGGNQAPYSAYGYYVERNDDNSLKLKDGNLVFKPRESATDSHLAVTEFSGIVPTEYQLPEDSEEEYTFSYAQPELNIISCTRIGKVFGGGLGETAIIYGNPTVNINMIEGAFSNQSPAQDNPNNLGAVGEAYTNADGEEEEGGVFGGGNQAPVYGNTTVNIGTARTVEMTSLEKVYAVEGDPEYDDTKEPEEQEKVYQKRTVVGAYIAGNVYGGGNLADVGKYIPEKVNGRDENVIYVSGNTNVNICAKYNSTSEEWEEVPFDASKIIIAGNVYGGGKGDDGTFTCEKAMVLGNKEYQQKGWETSEDTEEEEETEEVPGGTNVRIGNGTVGILDDDGILVKGTGNIYGGGEIARVEQNTAVAIGFGPGAATDGTSNPDIKGSVYGAGAGLRTHGYSALVRGDSKVIIEGNAIIRQNVYGGGEKATVGRYFVEDNIAKYNISGGNCSVVIGGYAEIGPDDMQMYHAGVAVGTDKPDDYGHVFGAGQGVLPYEGFEDSAPWSKIPDVFDEETGAFVTDRTTYTAYDQLGDGKVLEASYVKYLKTLALATETNVTIKESAFVKGSVYGGSENGFVQEDTHVTIQDDCQIGNGWNKDKDNGEGKAKGGGVNQRYTEMYGANVWTTSTSLPECASWPYGEEIEETTESGTITRTIYAPYDKFAQTTSGNEEKYSDGSFTEGGRRMASDGHTFYGNVFGGGSGYYPYKPGRWFVDAGAVYGDTYLTITGGHILTNVYGGNEMTDVGKFVLDDDGKPTTKIESGGKCIITMSGGTIGVPRTLNQIAAHPVTCYLFGAGKGDPRVFFNKSTNVGDVEVNITDGTIYGSVFGGGEDGHVLRDVTMTIGTQTTTGEGDQAETTTSGPTIGTWGTSYVDGNVFGGGRGFTGDAYTAGNVAGSVKMEIKGGSILGSVYGGGRLGSVGYGLFESTNTTNYGVMQDDDKDDEGNETDYYEKGAVGLGRGHIDITISGGTIGNGLEYIIPNATNMAEANIPESYRDISKWDDENNYWTQWKEYHKIPKTEFDTTTGRLTHTKGGNVFAGGMGNFFKQDGKTYINGVDWWKLGNAKSTKVTITGGTIKSNVYGGGELGQVVGYHTAKNAANQDVNVGTEVNINSGTIGTKVVDGSNVVQYTFGSVFGGGYGSLEEKIEVQRGTTITSYPKYIAGRVKAGTKVNMTAGSVLASVYGGGEMAAVGESKTLGETLTTGHSGDTYVSVSGGTVGIAPITISGSNRRYFGGAKMGNVYGGGSGHGNTVRSGHVYGNTNVTISAGSVSGEPNIYHNVYGGGAYGSVGDFTYQTGTDAQTETQKVFGVEGLNTAHTNSGVARVTITGGTIGYDGKENGMVFGSSRGDINEPGARDDHCAWVYDANVIIGTAAKGTPGQEGYVAATGPSIKGTVYGSGENGHVFNDAEVTINYGTIGIDDNTDPGYTVTSNGTEYAGAAYPYRGNVYGGGCGTDKYYENHDLETHDGNGQLFNSLAGIVYGTTTVNITGGKVVRNVYGAGAMGSVGKITTTTTNNVSTTTIPTGGTTTIAISGGTVGVDGNDNGNVFGAARGDAATTQKDVALVKTTNVTISGTAEIKGNVYGGGETGDVGTYTTDDEDTNTYLGESGVCNVTVSGGTIGHDGNGNGNVFGAGKGDASTFKCMKAMVKETHVSISKGLVKGNVYGGGELGRVEYDTHVTIGTESGSNTPEIIGSVFGAGAGVETHGYSALVRRDANVTVQGYAKVRQNVYGGGQIATVGRYRIATKANMDDPDFRAAHPGIEVGMPYENRSGGTCTVIVKGHAEIGPESGSATDNAGHVFGAGKGVNPFDAAHVDIDYTDADDPEPDKTKKPKRMTPMPDNVTGLLYDDIGGGFIWEYYTSQETYFRYLETQALASWTDVTIEGNATVMGSVYGGSESGFVQDDTDVKIKDQSEIGTTGATQYGRVYGGGKGLSGFYDAGRVGDETLITTTGGTIYGSVFGGGELGIVKNSVAVNISGGEVKQDVYGGGALANTNTACLDDIDKKGITTTVNLTSGIIEGDVYGGGLGQKVPSVIEAIVGGDVFVNLNGGEASTDENNCVVKGRIFGCNNLRGTPRGNVTVHVYSTENWAGHEKNANKNNSTYNVEAVYGGGNEAAYEPTDANPSSGTYYSYNYDENNEVYTRDGGDATTYTEDELCRANVIIDGCGLSSIKWVYGGGNSAPTPATSVTVNGCYEIGTVFGGGNGADDLSDGSPNLGANVGYRNYSYVDGGERKDYGEEDGDDMRADTKEWRRANYRYGTGKAETLLYGGTIHKAFGGSNTLGNVCSVAFSALDQKSDCDLVVGELYGAGNQAFMDAKIELDMGCVAGLSELYGGAYAATVNEDVHLKLTSGRYDKVFGGNNQSGTINGSITVDIEETGCYPIIIGQLYGGGNLAAYPGVDAAGDFESKITVNVKSFTSIGTIFGGGYGRTAIVTGDTYVNVNEYNGLYYDKSTTTDQTKNISGESVFIPGHKCGKIGTIGNIFGGGNAADVIGDTHINIGTEEALYEPVVLIVPGETDVSDYYTKDNSNNYTRATGVAQDETDYYQQIVKMAVENYRRVSVSVGADVSSYYIRSGEGTASSPYDYTPATGTAENGIDYYEKVSPNNKVVEYVKMLRVGANVSGYYINESGTSATGTAVAGSTYYKKNIVKGADIRLNVYGGGNDANVKGNTHVEIGKASD